MVPPTLSKLDGTWPSATRPGFEADLAGSRGRARSRREVFLPSFSVERRTKGRGHEVSRFLRGERPQLTGGSEGRGANRSRCRAAPRASLSRESVEEEVKLKKAHDIVSKRPLPALSVPVGEPAPPDLLRPLAAAAFVPVPGTTKPRAPPSPGLAGSHTPQAQRGGEEELERLWGLCPPRSPEQTTPGFP